MAVEQSVAQMSLTRDWGPGGFMERVVTLMALVGGSVLSEPADTPYRQGRVFYAQRVVSLPRQAAEQVGPILVMGVNITSTTTYDEETQTAICTATDTQIQGQIQVMWNTFAGLDTQSAHRPMFGPFPCRAAVFGKVATGAAPGLTADATIRVSTDAPLSRGAPVPAD